MGWAHHSRRRRPLGYHQGQVVSLHITQGGGGDGDFMSLMQASNSMKFHEII